MAYSLTQTAAFVRRALRRAFPRAKFSVVCDRHKRAVSVQWCGKPPAVLVDVIVDPFRAGDLDPATGLLVPRKGSEHAAQFIDCVQGEEDGGDG
jgi:hypothetical protein